MNYIAQNNNFHDYPYEKTIHSIFESMAVKIPNNTAIEFHDEHITYSELNESANNLAALLFEAGIVAGDIIAVSLVRSVNTIVSILAILKVGAAYLPIETNAPKARAVHYIATAKATTIISDQECDTLYEVPNININKMNDIVVKIQIPQVSSDALACILFTSGSTGEPKGVMLRHNSIVNILSYMKEEYAFCENDVFLHKQPYSFDFSLYELFSWFFCGARLCLLAPGQEGNAETVIKTIFRHGVTICSFVPSMLEVFIEYLLHRGGVYRLKTLKSVISGGEVLKYDVVNQFSSILTKANSTRLFNIYGPTETTINATSFDCTNYKSEDRIVPIGKPVWNTYIYILDEDGNKCTDEEKGEIYISGDGVASGYINNKMLTEMAFISDPFRINSIMYRTGDIGRWRNGFIEFLGRHDNQVKIHGYRIELEEIESHLIQFEGIKQAVVITSEESKNMEALIVFYTGEESIDSTDIITYLSTRLPSYMIPTEYVHVTSFIQTNSGKIDRKRVLECVVKNNNIAIPFEEIDNEITAFQESIFKVILSNFEGNYSDGISLETEFESIGIDSISFIKTVVLLESEFDFEFDDEMLLVKKFPTIRSMVDYVEQKIK